MERNFNWLKLISFYHDKKIREKLKKI